MDRFRLSVLDVSVVSTNFEPVTIEPAPFFGGWWCVFLQRDFKHTFVVWACFETCLFVLNVSVVQ